MIYKITPAEAPEEFTGIRLPKKSIGDVVTHQSALNAILKSKETQTRQECLSTLTNIRVLINLCTVIVRKANGEDYIHNPDPDNNHPEWWSVSVRFM